VTGIERQRWEKRTFFLGALGVLCAATFLARTYVFTVDQQYQQAPVSGIQIDVNTAGPADLALLDNIGPERARQIVLHRETHGPFRTYQDLLAVEGIGPKTLQSLVGRIMLGTSASDSRDPGASLQSTR